MKTRIIITIVTISTLILAYIALYGLASQTGTLLLGGNLNANVTPQNSAQNLSVLALQPSEFRIWFAQSNSSVPSDGGMSFVTTRSRLSLGILAVESATTVERADAQSGGASAVTASVAP